MASIDKLPGLARHMLDNMFTDARAVRLRLRTHAPDWDVARDRITESNEARADEREQCARLAENAGYMSLAARIRARSG